jgi:hypothetical protein
LGWLFPQLKLLRVAINNAMDISFCLELVLEDLPFLEYYSMEIGKGVRWREESEWKSVPQKPHNQQMGTHRTSAP